MSIDYGKLRDRLARMKNPESGGFTRTTWRPRKDEKESTVRLLEYPFGAGDPFVELWFHYGISRGPAILCPRKASNRTCPICDFAKELQEGGGDNEQVKDLWPKQRFHAVLVDREESDPSPKYWGFGTQVYQKLIEALLHEDYSKFLDPHSGIDMDVWTSKPKGKHYPSTDFRFRRKDTPLAATAEEIQRVLSLIKPIDEVYRPSTTAEIKERLSQWLTPDDSAENPDEVATGEVRGGGGGKEIREDRQPERVRESKPAASAVSEEDIESQFNAVMASIDD